MQCGAESAVAPFHLVCDFSIHPLLMCFLQYFLICMQVLGTPTREEIKCMNPNYTEFKFPQIKAHPWHKVLDRSRILLQFCYASYNLTNIDFHSYCTSYQIFHKRMPPEAVDLVSRLLQYSPNLRSTAVSTLNF